MGRVSRSLLLFLLLSAVTGQPAIPQSAPSSDSVLEAAAPVIEELVRVLANNRRYQQGLSEEMLVEAMLQGIMEAQQDSYAALLNTSTLFRPGGRQSARTPDIGLLLDSDEFGRSRVASILPGSPAADSGLQVGDRLLRVHGTNTAGMTPWEIAPLLASSEEGRVSLVAERPGEMPRELVLAPSDYQVETVSLRIGDHFLWRWRDDNEGRWAWLKVHAYLGEETKEEWTEAIHRIWEAPNVEAIILDLRNNGGGDNAGIRTLGDFFPAGKPLVRFRSLFGEEGWEEVVRNDAYPRARLIAYPLVVLVNENTASLAEIVAATLQEARGIMVVGSQTYGKGTTQSWVNISEEYAIHLTTARWYTPEGRSIDGRGIVPDVPAVDSRLTPWVDDELAAALRVLERR
jgi:carboxyl-terminal processing protease